MPLSRKGDSLGYFYGVHARYEEFMSACLQLGPDSRYGFEMIRETQQCNMYFDIESFRVLSSGGTFEFRLIDSEDASSHTPGITQCNQGKQVELSESVNNITQIGFSTQTVDASMQTSQLDAAIDDKHKQTQKTNLVDVLSKTLSSMVPVVTPVAER